jgi:hypothetical protein
MCWKREARKAGIAGGSEKAERIPAVPPGIANPQIGIENQKAASEFRKMVSHGETGLSSADHDGLNSFNAVQFVHWFSDTGQSNVSDCPDRSRIGPEHGLAHREKWPFFAFEGMGNFM